MALEEEFSLLRLRQRSSVCWTNSDTLVWTPSTKTRRGLAWSATSVSNCPRKILEVIRLALMWFLDHLISNHRKKGVACVMSRARNGIKSKRLRQKNFLAARPYFRHINFVLIFKVNLFSYSCHVFSWYFDCFIMFCSF